MDKLEEALCEAIRKYQSVEQADINIVILQSIIGLKEQVKKLEERIDWIVD